MGRRAETIDELTRLLGGNRRRDDKISAITAARIYEEVTGEIANIEDGRGHHLSKALEAADIDCNKIITGQAQVPLHEMQQLLKTIKNT